MDTCRFESRPKQLSVFSLYNSLLCFGYMYMYMYMYVHSFALPYFFLSNYGNAFAFFTKRIVHVHVATPLKMINVCLDLPMYYDMYPMYMYMYHPKPHPACARRPGELPPCAPLSPSPPETGLPPSSACGPPWPGLCPAHSYTHTHTHTHTPHST